MISVITSTYNHASFLRGAVQSVREQGYTDWEHIVIDDGSTDQTEQLLVQLGQEDPRLHSFRTTNQGQAAALNLGLSRAKGEWIAFLDSDDEFMPQHLEYMLQFIGEQSFALGRFEIVNCSPKKIPVVRDFYQPGKVIPVEDIEVVTGVLFGRKEAFDSLGGFRSVLSVDTDLFTRAKAAGHIFPRAERASYRYFFGRVPNSLALRELQASLQSRK